jgi:hypothetical protein
MAYVFAISFLNQYPSEKVGPSDFACDPSLRNAKFSSILQSRAVPSSDSEQAMIDMLDEQNLTLKVDLVNTNFSCMKVSVFEVIGTSSTELRYQSCNNSDGILSMSIALVQHDITVQIVISDTELIGAVRMGLVGRERSSPGYTLKELNFRRVIRSEDARTYAQSSSIRMAITKVSVARF